MRQLSGERVWRGLRAARGITLVELMIVVVIIGILAGLAGIGYTKFMDKGRIQRLESYVMEVSQGQEDFRSRHGAYFPGGAGVQVTKYSTNQLQFERVLGLSRELTDGVEIEVRSGPAATGCGGACLGAEPDTTRNWYHVMVSQDTDDNGVPVQVVFHPDLPSPLILNEGE